MTHLAIVAWDGANRVIKYQDYPTAEEATAHVARVLATFPDAFSTVSPGGGPRDWLVNPVQKTLSFNPPPPPPPRSPPPLTAEELAVHLITKGTITQTEVDDIKAGRG